MKKVFFSVFPAIVILLLISACNAGSLKGSGIPESKKAYIGTWSSDEIILSIDSSGMLDYKKEAGSVSTSVNAPIQRFEGDSFIAGALGINTTFDVTHAPHQENGVWKMTVDGRELTKQD